MIGNMALIRAKLEYHGAVTDSEIVKDVVTEFIASDELKAMREGVRYYEGDHDVLKIDFRQKYVYEDKDRSPELIENKNKSNYHNVHNFYETLVNQKIGYILGAAPSITVNGATENNELQSYELALSSVISDEDFLESLSDYAEGASNKGREWLHVYYDRDGKLEFCIVPAENVIPFWDTSNKKTLTDLFRFYEVEVNTKTGSAMRKRVEWWTASNVTYYMENEKGEYVFESRRAHWTYETWKDGALESEEPQAWGRVPFIPLFNNKRQMNDLKGVKGLIDAYNIISSTTTNDEIDLVQLYWLVMGYGAETAAAIQAKLSINKAVSISDNQGKIEGKQVKLEVSERIAWLKLLRSDIFSCGMGIDIDDDKLYGAASGKALAFKYSQLDLKVKPLIGRLTKAIKEMAWYITEDINLKNGTSYDAELVKVSINKTTVVEDSELIKKINDSRGLVPDKMLLALHPLVRDVGQAEEQMRAQREEELEWEIKRMNAIAGDDSSKEPLDLEDDE